MRKVRLPMENIKVTENRIRKTKKTPEEYETLKKSIRMLGLSNPIIVTQGLELITGYWRLKVFKELHEKEPDNVEFYDIPTLIVLAKEEIADLRLDFFEGTDYMRDTAIDRLNIIYDPRLFDKKELHEFLKIPELEVKHRLRLGEAIRENEDNPLFNDYKKEKITHIELYTRIFMDKVYDSEETFDIDEWL